MVEPTAYTQPCSTVLTDLTVVLAPLNLTLFPGSPLLATAHVGFQAAHARTATIVLDTVKKIVAERCYQSRNGRTFFGWGSRPAGWVVPASTTPLQRKLGGKDDGAAQPGRVSAWCFA